jgi:hypothetical protein
MKLVHMKSKFGRRGGKQFGNGPHIRGVAINGRFESRGRHRSRADIPQPWVPPLSARQGRWERGAR